MTRELLILRHGKSSWQDMDLADHDRPLKKRGITAARKMGRYLAARGLRPQVIISSTAERARHTAVLACEEMGIAWQLIHLTPHLYHAPVQAFLDQLAQCSQDVMRLMMVGHNPGMEELIAYLCGQQTPEPEDGKLLPTAALARIAMPADWHALDHGCGNLLALIRPRLLKANGREK